MIPPKRQSSTTFVLRRMFDAPRERVFRAWIEPEALEAWLRPGGKAVAVRSLDARVGGSFHFELENGSSIVGVYQCVDPPEKLAFTWSVEFIQQKETIVTLDFLDHGAMTEVVLTHEGLNTSTLQTLFGNGWRSLFDALALALSSTSLVNVLPD